MAAFGSGGIKYDGRMTSGPGREVRLLAKLVGLAFIPGLALAAQAAPLNYDRDVRPILSENCFPCHGQDGKKRMAGLRLDSFEGATADRGGKVALSPGKPESSEIYKRITAADKSRR